MTVRLSTRSPPVSSDASFSSVLTLTADPQEGKDFVDAHRPPRRRRPRRRPKEDNKSGTPEA